MLVRATPCAWQALTWVLDVVWHLTDPGICSTKRVTCALACVLCLGCQPGLSLFQICFLLFAVLYVISYFIITRYKRKSGKCTPRELEHSAMPVGGLEMHPHPPVPVPLSQAAQASV